MTDLPNLFYVQLQEQCDGVTWVKVVRCKDCKWKEVCKINFEYKGADGYCSKGKRKEDER